MSLDVQATITALIAREGGSKFTDNPNDRGGKTRWGVTEQVARAYGYTGDMRELSRELAHDIYLERYWTGPHFDLVAARSGRLAEELLDTGVNMGPQVAARFLQRALNVLNRGATAYPDVIVDGQIGRMTLFALDKFLEARGGPGLVVLLRMLNGQQAVRYIEIAESRPQNEEFEFGWLLNRVA